MSGHPVRRFMIITAGALLALIMAGLGLWQMRVFEDQGNASSAARAAQPPVPLLDHVHEDGTMGDVYGKRVTASGTYLPDQQLLIPTGEGSRVLTAMRLADGRVLAIVRGTTSDTTPPLPPPGEQRVLGIFLPGEGEVEGVAPPVGGMSSVRMPVLAQLWPQQLLSGFVTLDAAGAQAQSLDPAEVKLPSGKGRFRNSGYAVQWWVFGAFALGMSIKVARDLDKRDAAREADSATVAAD